MGYTLHATKKLLQRLKAPVTPAPNTPYTRLANWYANILLWKPHVVLFTNETTLLPVLVPYAPSATLLARFPIELEKVLLAHNIPQHLVSTELTLMLEVNLAPTANRHVMGHLNEFAWQAEGYMINSNSLLQVSLKLADTPCNYLKELGYNPREAVQTLLLSSTVDEELATLEQENSLTAQLMLKSEAISQRFKTKLTSHSIDALLYDERGLPK